MPKSNMTSNPGNANIVRQGHTTTGQHGTDPNIKGKGRKPVRDLKVK